MIAETALATTAHEAIPKLIKSTICILGKQALERSAKEALDRALKPALVPPISCQSQLQQALFAIDADESEAQALQELFRSGTFEGVIRACGLFAGTDSTAIQDQVRALNEILTRLLPDRPAGALDSLSTAVLDYVIQIAEQSWQTAVELSVKLGLQNR